MGFELVRGPHSVGEANLHLQFTPKYRRDVFRDDEVKGVCMRSFKQTAEELGVMLHAVETKLWGDAFWSSGYFYRSVGSTTNEAINWYIEHAQRKHWKALDHQAYKELKQKTLTHYMN